MDEKQEAQKAIGKIVRRADELEKRMVALLEKRMELIARAAAYKWRFGLMKYKKKEEENPAGKAAVLSCSIDLVEYTEGLVKYLDDTAKRYERKIASDLDWKLRNS